MSINRVILVGRLTKDPQLTYTPSGVAVARFTLAVNRNFSGANGEKEADFIQIQVWRKPAENTANFLKKGSLAGVEGRIQTGSYEGTDGKRVYTTEVVADSVQFLEPRNSSSERTGEQYKATTIKRTNTTKTDRHRYRMAGNIQRICQMTNRGDSGVIQINKVIRELMITNLVKALAN
jgi:single-strand DNA-binding protein